MKNVYKMMAYAFMCDQTRVLFTKHNNLNGNYWHHGPKAKAGEPPIIPYEKRGGPEYMYGSKPQKDRLDIMLEYLIKPLKNTPDPSGNGSSLLDNTLIVWHNEHAGRSHGMHDIPCITFGNHDGAYNTGYVLDYRQDPRRQDSANSRRRGMPCSRFLISILKGMGLSDSEINRHGDGNGFGYFPESVNSGGSSLTSKFYPESWFKNNRNKPLPFFYKG